MNNEEYVKSVNLGEFPTDIKVPIDFSFRDARGEIINLWLGNSGSITLIKSVKDSVRAKHSHSGDWHSIYMLSGKVVYLEKDEHGNIQETIFNQGEMFFTKPDIYHEVKMLEDTVFLTINGIVKNHQNYENSVQRI